VQHGKNNVVKRSTNNVEEICLQQQLQGKNPMTRTQWRRYQRSKKGIVVSLEDKTVDLKGSQRGPSKERLSLPLVKKDPNEDDELGSKFMDSEPDFDVICNIVSILPAEYDMVSEVDDSEEEFDPRTWRNTNPCATS
jgi:hypothetical protein